MVVFDPLQSIMSPWVFNVDYVAYPIFFFLQIFSVKFKPSEEPMIFPAFPKSPFYHVTFVCSDHI